MIDQQTSQIGVDWLYQFRIDQKSSRISIDRLNLVQDRSKTSVDRYRSAQFSFRIDHKSQRIGIDRLDLVQDRSKITTEKFKLEFLLGIEEKTFEN